ncbi:MFS transporter [Cucumibacter marinus]|uniref:MFS transporter n=1 Tax=Cucumibacter marinus TaxID=1121252 RepID=UPI00048E4E98|nr:MFS transporter [Cucumibacter marinus]
MTVQSANTALPETPSPATPRHSTWADLARDGRLPLTATLVVAIGSHALNGFLTLTIVPSMVAELGGREVMYWVFALFQISAIISGTLAGAIKARIGARETMLVGIGLVAIGSVIAGTAGDLTAVLIGRGLQGVGEGLIISVSHMLIAASYPGWLMPRMFSAQSVIWAAAAGFGPLAAGTLTELVSWRAAFLVNLPLAALMLVQALTAIPAQDRTTARSPGFRPPLLRMASLAAAVLALCMVGQSREPGLIALYITVAVVLLAMMAGLDRRAVARLLPADLFKPASWVRLGFLIAVLTPLGTMATGVLVPSIAQSVWGFGPTQAGYYGTLLALSWTTGSLTVVGIANTDTQLRIVRLGLFLITVGMTICALALSMPSPWVMAAGIAMIGYGYGTHTLFLDKFMIASASETERDRVSGMMPPVDSTGRALGAAFAGFLALSLGLFDGAPVDRVVAPEAVLATAPQIFIIGAAVVGLAGLTALRLPNPATIANARI